MSTKLILVRHGETEWNKKRLMQGGKSDNPLSETGVEQARQLAKRLAIMNIDVIYSSPLIRALNTAEEISKETRKKVNVVDALIERDFGEWEGRPSKEIIKEYPGRTGTTRPRNGESYYDVRKRIIPVVEKMIKKNNGKSVLISGHGASTRVILGHYLGTPVRYWHRIALKNCSISQISFHKNGQIIDYVNQTL